MSTNFCFHPGCLHPQEVSALLYGIVYYITIPSMYMLLVIYSVFNMNDVSWGTRENADPNAAAGAAAPNKQVLDHTVNIPKFQLYVPYSFKSRTFNKVPFKESYHT